MTTLRELIARYDLKFKDRNFKKADATIAGAIGKLKTLGGLVAGGFAVAGISRFIQDFIQAGDSIDKVSSKLGLTTDTLQELRHAAQLTGVTSRQLDTGFQRFSRRLAEAAQGTGTAKDTFKELGIQLRDANGTLRTADDVLGDVADRIAATEGQADRVRIAFKFFDRDGVGLVNTLQGGKESLQKMRQELHDLGGVMSKEMIDRTVKLTDDLLRFKQAMLGVKTTMASYLIPAANWMINTITKGSKWFRKFAKDTNIVKSALIVLGAVGFSAGMKILIPFIPILAAIAAVTMVVDELITTFQGGDTILRDFIDSMFGVGATETLVHSLTEAWQWLVATLKEATEGYLLWADNASDTLDKFLKDFKTGWDEAFQIFDRFVSWASDLWDGFLDWMSNIIPEPVKQILGLAGKSVKGNIRVVGRKVDNVIKDASHLQESKDRAVGYRRGMQVEKESRERARHRERVYVDQRGMKSDIRERIRERMLERREVKEIKTNIVSVPSKTAVRPNVVQIRTPQTSAISGAKTVNQNNNFNMSITTQGKTNINELTRAGRKMGRDAATYQERATYEALRQKVGG